MKITFTLLTLLLFIQSFAQQHTCAKRDAFSGHQMKSNSLSLNQIERTLKYDVHFYALDIAMDNLSTDVAGTGEIHGTATETLDSVLFELFDTFTITEIRLNGSSTPYTRNGSAITVPVNLSAGQSFAIAVDYDGTPPTQATNPLGGSGMTNDNSPTWGNQVTWSLSEPFSAYEWWPCKQYLGDKADSISVKITVPNACKAGSNGVLENVVDLGNGTSRYEWFHRHPIDYYLVSVAVAEYVEYNVMANPAGSAQPVLIQNYIYDNPGTLPNFQTDIDETVDFIELFADLYGPYPFDDEKYGHCMAPLSGGMEHQTMTTQGFFEKGLTAHELGHQWWGDYVTCASWADIWVNEGFASYSEYLMKENLYPSETNQHMYDIHTNVKSDPNGSVWVQDSLDEGRIFSGRLTYDKGAAIIHTFRYIINNDNLFFQAMKDFMNTYADSVARGIDVYNSFEASTGVDFSDAFAQWYFGEGYPIYSARWSLQGNDMHLEVTHTTSSSTPTFTHPVDLFFIRSNMPDTTIRVNITANLNQFVIPNMQGTVQLNTVDPDNWIINETGTLVRDQAFVASVENQKEVNISIYPNPSSGIFNVNLNNIEVERYRVYNVSGQMVKNGTLTNNKVINLQEYEDGFYILKLETNTGNTYIETIVKK